MARWRSWLPQALLIAVATLWVFSPAWRGEWLWDDVVYIRDNAIIRDPLGFLKVWTHRDGQGDYYPLTQLVWWFEWQFLGKSTAIFHAGTIALHLANAFLLWMLLERLGLRWAWVGALVFAVHPGMVESVAWIAELKNTLSVFLLLLSMICWLEWKNGAPGRFYHGALLCFALSLLAKIGGLMLPFVLLGQIWATRGRIERKDLREVAPFFVVMLVFAFITFLPHDAADTPVKAQAAWTLGNALAAVGWALALMLGKCVWPVDLRPLYYGYGLEPLRLLDVLPWLGFGGLFFVLWRARNSWGRIPLLGLGFFVLNLVPVLGYIFLHYTKMVWSVDHLVYLAIIGPIAAGVAALDRLDAWLGAVSRMIVRFAVALVIAMMAWKSHAYAGDFSSGEALWAPMDALEPDSAIVQQNFGSSLIDHHKYDLAVPNLQRALQLDPQDSKPLIQLGEIAVQKGDVTQAETDYRRAMEMTPKSAMPYFHLGNLMSQAGRKDEAIDFYRQAVAITPDGAQVQYDLGNLLLQSGDFPGALEHLEKSARLDPSVATTHDVLAIALVRSDRLDEAIVEFRQAVRLEPQESTAHANLGLALMKAGRLAEATEQFQLALQLDPGNMKARAALAKLQQSSPPASN